MTRPFLNPATEEALLDEVTQRRQRLSAQRRTVLPQAALLAESYADAYPWMDASAINSFVQAGIPADNPEVQFAGSLAARQAAEDGSLDPQAEDVPDGWLGTLADVVLGPTKRYVRAGFLILATPLQEVQAFLWSAGDAVFGEIVGRIFRHSLCQRRNQDALLRTGHPITRFEQSPWFASYLARLYYGKRPVIYSFPLSSVGAPPEFVGRPQRDEFGDMVFSYLWTEETPRPPIGVVADQAAPYDRVFQHPFDIDMDVWRPCTEDGRDVTYCDYEDAGYMLGLSHDDDERLTRMRPMLFDLRLRVLERLMDAARQDEASGLWLDCW